MIILSIFGTARGLEVINLPLSNTPIPFQLENQWLEISLDEIALKANQDTVFINRRMIAGNTLTWIGVYQHVFEMGYQRQGSFLGAGVWLINSMITADILLPILRNMAQQLKDKATNQVQFIRRIEEIKNDFTFNPSDLTSHEIAITHGLNSFADLGFFAPKDHPNDIIDMVNWAQNARGADLFNRGYISPQDTTVTPTAGTTRKQITLRNRNEADLLYAKKLGEVSEQVNQLNRHLLDVQQHLSNSEQRALQLENKNNNLNKEILNTKDEMSQLRGEFEKRLNATRLDYEKRIAQMGNQKPQKPSHPTKPTNNPPSNNGVDWAIVILVLLIGILIGSIGALLINQEFFNNKPTENKTVEPIKNNPIPISPTQETTNVEDLSCKDLKLNTFSLSFSTREGMTGDDFIAETLAKNILQKVCQSTSSYDKYSSCKTQYKEFVSSIQRIKTQPSLKGEVKIPDYCLTNDPKSKFSYPINKTTVELKALPPSPPPPTPIR